MQTIAISDPDPIARVSVCLFVMRAGSAMAVTWIDILLGMDIIRLHHMHEMLTFLTDVCGVCLSCGLNWHGACSVHCMLCV